MTTLKERYLQIKKKYSLPDYELLNIDFEIEDISPDSEIILQRIRQKMNEKMGYYAEMIESLLQPESLLSDMYEAHYLEESYKNKMYSLFKKLKKIIRKSHEVSLNNNNEENAKFIDYAWREWNALKEELRDNIKRITNLWDKETDIKEDLSYFG